jgi:hypothetical protein
MFISSVLFLFFLCSCGCAGFIIKNIVILAGVVLGRVEKWKSAELSGISRVYFPRMIVDNFMVFNSFQQKVLWLWESFCLLGVTCGEVGGFWTHF